MYKLDPWPRIIIIPRIQRMWSYWIFLVSALIGRVIVVDVVRGRQPLMQVFSFFHPVITWSDVSFCKIEVTLSQYISRGLQVFLRCCATFFEWYWNFFLLQVFHSLKQICLLQYLAGVSYSARFRHPGADFCVNDFLLWLLMEKTSECLMNNKNILKDIRL